MQVLRPIWNTKTRTADEVRGQIEQVLDAAKARKLRDGDNPARWRGHLDNLLSRAAKKAAAKRALIYTGMRWHVRAYCEKNRDYRDFVLSRFRGAPELMHNKTEHTREQDPGWSSQVQVIIEPDSRLKPEQQAIIETDYGMQSGRLVIETRGALCSTCCSAIKSIQPRCTPSLLRSRLLW